MQIYFYILKSAIKRKKSLQIITLFNIFLSNVSLKWRNDIMLLSNAMLIVHYTTSLTVSVFPFYANRMKEINPSFFFLPFHKQICFNFKLLKRKYDSLGNFRPSTTSIQVALFKFKLLKHLPHQLLD